MKSGLVLCVRRLMQLFNARKTQIDVLTVSSRNIRINCTTQKQIRGDSRQQLVDIVRGYKLKLKLSINILEIVLRLSSAPTLPIKSHSTASYWQMPFHFVCTFAGRLIYFFALTCVVFHGTPHNTNELSGIFVTLSLLFDVDSRI